MSAKEHNRLETRPTGDCHGSRTKPVGVRRGESHHNVEFSTEQIVYILTLYASGSVSQASLGRQFGVKTAILSRWILGMSREQDISPKLLERCKEVAVSRYSRPRRKVA